MKFRTEIEPLRAPFGIEHSDAMLLLGSCFTDEVGQRLVADGFDAVANPLGPIYNPVMLARTLGRALAGSEFVEADLIPGPRGMHCLDYATRYSGPLAPDVLSLLNGDMASVSVQLRRQPVVILTFGSAYVYEHSGRVVGNCHKFPASDFERRLLTPDEICRELVPVLSELLERGCRVILTVSPIRHLADGLHGNTLSKATLHLALEQLRAQLPRIAYFPAFEILVDDLRDYRFYTADMKHPSEVAVDYIYDIFSQTFMSADTRRAAQQARKDYKHSLHRPIL